VKRGDHFCRLIKLAVKGDDVPRLARPREGRAIPAGLDVVDGNVLEVVFSVAVAVETIK
jgi:hypothetical protein